MENIIITEDEAMVLYKAMHDYETTGKTDRRCPRCGNTITVEVSGNSARATCDTAGCLSVTRRGL